MTTLGVVYPQFWATNGDEVEEIFHTYLAILKATFCVLHKMGENENIVHVFLSSQALDLETFFLKMTVLHNVKKKFARKKPIQTSYKILTQNF
jgi:hypothetical protein